MDDGEDMFSSGDRNSKKGNADGIKQETAVFYNLRGGVNFLFG
jgi:hypothetical protein